MILCCGEALIDMIPLKGEDGQPAFSPLSGGAIFNTAIALGRLEVPVGLLSGVSNDLFGTRLVDDLNASGVSTDLLIRSDRMTTLAFVKLTDGHAEYTFYDENSAGSTFGVSDIPGIPTVVSCIYAGGISLCAEPAANSYEALYLREASARVTMLDPNIRLSFISDEPAYRARLDKMIAVSDVVKVSDEDLDWIVPTDTTLETKVAILQEIGAHMVILTKGADGATAYVAGQPQVDVSVPKVEVIDTVGAGDTFNAGFLAKLSKLGCLSKNDIKNLSDDQCTMALKYAVQVAAINVSRKGANPPRLAEINT
jgi:fructokinase